MVDDRDVRLELRDVSLCIHDGASARPLAEGLQLHLRANSLIAVNGASGSGKSTLLRTIIRMHPCASGEIFFAGSTIDSYHPPVLRQRVAYLRQFPVFGPGTVAASLTEAWQWKANSSTPPSDDDLASRVEKLGLDTSILRQETHNLSGGEAQRIALLRALLLQPDILLLDESTANLDPDHEETIMNQIEQWVTEESHAAIWVTHSRELLRQLDVDSYRLTRHGFQQEASV